jgi:hypothetical protein
MKDIWNYELSSNSVLPYYDKSDITKNKGWCYADKYANDLLRETAPRLSEIEYKTEESILKYYSRQIEEVNTKLNEFEQRLRFVRAQTILDLFKKRKSREQILKMNWKSRINICANLI